MTEEDILKFGEIQYLKGRLDELYNKYNKDNNSEIIDIGKYNLKTFR